jgi:hypothetical protein
VMWLDKIDLIWATICVTVESTTPLVGI